MTDSDRQIEIINKAMLQNLNDRCKQYGRTAQRYYEGNHDILKYRLFYIDSDGEVKEDKNRSNIKISHPFFTELTDQQVQYMLSGKDGFVFSDLPDLQELLDKRFNNNDDFIAELNSCLTSVVIKGSEYMYAYVDENGKVCFEDADSTNIQEMRENDTDDFIKYIVRWYVDRIDKDGQPIIKIELWDENQTWFYIKEGEKGVKVDENAKINPRPHLIKFIDENSYTGQGFGFLPFFRLDNNDKRMSDLRLTKGLIDDYDLMSCSLSNNLEDFTEGLWVVKGYDGDNLDELTHNLKVKKAVGVDSDGDVEIKTINIPYEARKAKMELDEKNIYRFGMGFNSTQIGDGNVTNVVIKSRYTLLDLKSNKLEIRLKKFLRKLVKVVIDQYNSDNGTAFDLDDVRIQFTRETISNDSDNASIALTDAQRKQTLVDTLVQLSDVLDPETWIQQICDVLEINYEDIKDKVDTKSVEDRLDEVPDEDMEDVE